MTEERINQIIADLTADERAAIAKEILAKIVAAETTPKKGVDTIAADIKAWGDRTKL